MPSYFIKTVITYESYRFEEADTLTQAKKKAEDFVFDNMNDMYQPSIDQSEVCPETFEEVDSTLPTNTYPEPKCPICDSELDFSNREIINRSDNGEDCGVDHYYCTNKDCETNNGGTIKVNWDAELLYGEPYYE